MCDRGIPERGMFKGESGSGSELLNLPRNRPGGFRKNHPVLLKKETLFTELQKNKIFWWSRQKKLTLFC